MMVVRATFATRDGCRVRNGLDGKFADLCGGSGFRVTDPSQLEDALAEAIAENPFPPSWRCRRRRGGPESLPSVARLPQPELPGRVPGDHRPRELGCNPHLLGAAQCAQP